jgi:fucose 4-O-acetylase-like acetyltransferase
MGAGAQRGRLHAIDHIKAAAIIAVVFTHAGKSAWAPRADSYDFFLTWVWTLFHVPSFLFLSGFLYARSRGVDLAHVRSRLSRVLIPYLIASGVAQVAGVTAARSLSDVAYQFVTASSLGVYYYIFIIIVCIPLIWPLSRMGRRGVWAAWLACFALTVAFEMDRSLRPATSLLWSLRDPLEKFQLGYFLSGWLAALALPEISRLYDRHARLAAWLGGAGCLLGLAMFARLVELPIGTFQRVVYTFGVIGTLTIATRGRPAGPVVRFLGDASLSIYLYHRIFQLLVRPVTDGWHDPVRIAGQVAVGLGGASLLVLAGRRLLGAQRSRRLLGG